MYIVTGGAGFIGSNIVMALNQKGIDNIIIVDDLTDGTKFNNIADCKIHDYIDKDDFLKLIIQNHKFKRRIKAVFHNGACSSTTEWDGKMMMQNNYEYSKILLNYCITNKVQFIYASSASVYGAGTVFEEHPENEHPLNVYGYSKFLFDHYVRHCLPDVDSQIVGLRYFNVYGPREQHKGTMASVAFHLNNQLKENGKIRLFEGSDGYGNGEQRRDFIYIDDVSSVNLWFLDNAHISGIYNVGTGRSQTFNDVANSVLEWHNKGELEYIPFPEHLKGRYQSFTQADISNLRKAGYQAPFRTVEEGVASYMDWLNR